MALAERILEWAEGYKAEGMQQGEALALQKLLAKRFGVIPAETLGKIAAASATQIDAWLDVVLDAPTLAAVFGDAPGAV